MTSTAQPPATQVIKLTYAEFSTEADLRFGGWSDWAGVCPSCGDISTNREWELTTDPIAAGYTCIGYYLPRRGCTYTGGGSWEVLIPGTSRVMRTFPLAGDPAPDGPVERFLRAMEAAR